MVLRELRFLKRTVMKEKGIFRRLQKSYMENFFTVIRLKRLYMMKLYLALWLKRLDIRIKILMNPCMKIKNI